MQTHQGFGSAADMAALKGMSPFDEFMIIEGAGVGGVYEYRGGTAGWVQTHDASGAVHVAARRVISQDYITEDEITPAGTPITIALADGVGFVEIENIGATTENIRFAWGTSSGDAETNLTIVGDIATTGELVYAYADKPERSVVIRDRPADATHISLCNAVTADTPNVIVKQGSY